MNIKVSSLISVFILLPLILLPKSKQKTRENLLEQVLGTENNSVSIQEINITSNGTTELVSVGDDWSYANGYRPSISGDGRYVAFDSSYGGLVSDDMNGRDDIFVKDRETGQIERVSVRSNGTEGEGYSHTPSISANGRYIAFLSGDSTLVPGDNNFSWDVFVHDRQTGITQRVSIASDGTESEGISYNPSISGDGRYVAFDTQATNLVNEDTNGWSDVFIHDRVTSHTERVSVTSDGSQAENGWSESPSVSFDGRFVAFHSAATNLNPLNHNGPDIFVHDRLTGETVIASIASDGTPGNSISLNPSISADGRYVSFESLAENLVSGDTNGEFDVFVHDMLTGVTVRASVASDGEEGNGESTDSSISEDGQFVAFLSYANNLVSQDTNLGEDVYIHDLQTGQTERVSIANDGSQAEGHSDAPSISYDGDSIAFVSSAGNLICIDPDPYTKKVFVHDRSGNFSTVSGRVIHTNNTPVANVTISDGAGHSTKTDMDGYYLFNDVFPCKYTVSPSNDMYYFSPDFIEIVAPPGSNDLNFLGIGPTFIPIIIN